MAETAAGELLRLDQALAAYAAELRPLPARRVRIERALDRVLADDLAARHDLPHHDQSALDGYALRAADTVRAGAGTPIRLRVIGELAAGRAAEVPQLPPHAAWRIYTGAWMPPGADAMIAQERVAREDDDILLAAPVAAGTNVRRRGEELASGAPLASAGQRLTPGLLAALAAAGHGELPVRRRPRLAVIDTGDELTAPGALLEPGQLHDSNGVALTTLLQRWGLRPHSVARVPDQPQLLAAALAGAAAADLIVTTGGASVGDRDHLKLVAAQLGFKTVFWGVAQLPGKPLLFARRGAQFLLGLPGNPAAVVLCAALHLRRLVDLLEGVALPSPRWRHGVLSAAVPPNRARERLLRVELDEDSDGRARLAPLPHQSSHMLSNLGRAQALARIPAGTEPLAAGSVVAWLPLFEALA
ncbi:MAG: molybdopterin molybdotransferase MoeA [Gammaproteobacteria bacterium]|nr:molybdopterin molybdotransferase MoeA [Gammaproteobacteria bacterium]